MKTVQVDFNMVVGDGLVLASPRWTSAPLEKGDLVEAVDFDDPDMSFICVVEDFDDDGFAYLSTEWHGVKSSSLAWTFEGNTTFITPLPEARELAPVGGATGGIQVRPENMTFQFFTAAVA